MLKELSLSRLAKPSGPKAQKGKPQLKDELQNRSFWLRRKEGWRERKEGASVVVAPVLVLMILAPFLRPPTRDVHVEHDWGQLLISSKKSLYGKNQI